MKKEVGRIAWAWATSPSSLADGGLSGGATGSFPDHGIQMRSYLVMAEVEQSGYLWPASILLAYLPDSRIYLPYARPGGDCTGSVCPACPIAKAVLLHHGRPAGRSNVGGIDHVASLTPKGHEAADGREADILGAAHYGACSAPPSPVPTFCIGQRIIGFFVSTALAMTAVSPLLRCEALGGHSCCS